MIDTRRDELTERYVWAVARHLPASMREDVSEELRGTIEDMAADRGDEHAVREVLLDLGEPAALAARFSGARRHLIGPAVYDDYIRLLKALAVTVLPLVLVAFLVVRFWDPDQAVVPGILSAVGSTIGVAIQIGFWATLTFAIIERSASGVEALRETTSRGVWTPEDLPAAPGPRQIGLGDTVASLVMLAALLVYVVLQHFRSTFTDADGQAVPMLDPALWDFWLPLLMVLVLAGMALEVWKYREGVWSWRVTVANVALDLALLAYFGTLVAVTDVLNPAWTARLEQEADVDPGTGVTVTVVVIAAIVVWDAVEGLMKHRGLPETAAV